MLLLWDSANYYEMTKGGWIWKENLLAFLMILSDIVSYNFDESDWEAISYGLVVLRMG